MDIIYHRESVLKIDEFRDLLIRSTLGARKPIDDPDRLKAMCKNANLIVTARLDGVLIGIARSLSDFSFCTYLSDLAVDLEYQHQGIGKRLIYETQVFSKKAGVILLSAPNAATYCPKIGMTKHEDCFMIREASEIKFD